MEVFQGVLGPDGVADKQRCIGEIIEEGCRFFIDHRQVLVNAIEGEAAFQPVNILLEVLLGRHPGLALLPVPDGAEGFSEPLWGIIEHLSGGGDHRFLHHLAAALGIGLELADGVHLIPPKLHSVGVGALGRVKVQDAAPVGELAHPFHLLPPLIAGLEKESHQLLHGKTLPWVDGHRPGF